MPQQYDNRIRDIAIRTFIRHKDRQ